MSESVDWENQVVEGYGPTPRTIGQLLRSWQAEVQRFERELDKTLDDHTVWVAHDYEGALYLRDAIGDAFRKLSPAQRDAAEGSITAADECFLAITEPGADQLVPRFLVLPRDVTRGWWWSRVPRRGPVREEMNGVLG